MATMPSDRTRLGLVVVVALVGLGLFWSWRSLPHVPRNAATAPIATVAPVGAVATDAPSGASATELPTTPSGEGCLDKLTFTDASMSLCWQVLREGKDSDPAQDAYSLRVYGTFQAAQWAVVRAHVVAPAEGATIIAHWPAGDMTTACQALAPGGFGGSVSPRPGQADPCALLLGPAVGGDPTRSSVSWTCNACDRSATTDRPIELRQVVSVPEGVVPTWELFAAAGS
jgi:hypothetical protein